MKREPNAELALITVDTSQLAAVTGGTMERPLPNQFPGPMPRCLSGDAPRLCDTDPASG